MDTTRETTEHRGQVREALIGAGLSVPTLNILPPAGPVSQERREELARLFATGRPLSDLIVEEREGR